MIFCSTEPGNVDGGASELLEGWSYNLVAFGTCLTVGFAIVKLRKGELTRTKAAQQGI